MNMKFLFNLIALQGGAIIHASDCTDDEVETARKLGTLAIVEGHAFVYRGKVWMANVKQLLKKQQDNERRAEELGIGEAGAKGCRPRGADNPRF